MRAERPLKHPPTDMTRAGYEGSAVRVRLCGFGYAGSAVRFRLCWFGYATSEPAPVVVVVIMTCGGLCNVLWIVQCSIAFWKRSSFSGGR